MITKNLAGTVGAPVRAAYLRRALALGTALAALLALLFPAAAGALTTLSEGYTASTALAVGSLVSLQKNTSDQVDPSSNSNANDLLGIVINSENSLLSVSSDQANQVQVATSGIVQALVSNINGDISEGDQITASPISGVGMKATSSVKIIGIAQDSLNTSNASQQTYTDKGGQKHTVLIGDIPLFLDVSYYYKQPDKTIIPSSVQKLANALAGKPVNPLPIIVSMGIFIVTMVIVVSMVYSMIHGSIISVGRNPLSQSAIYRNLIQLSVSVVGIMGVAIVAIYMVLTKF